MLSMAANRVMAIGKIALPENGAAGISDSTKTATGGGK